MGKNQPRSSVLFATEMSEYSEERLGELITLLPAAPVSWTAAATELPRARAVMDDLVARASADRRLHQAMLADLEEALRDAGVDPRPALLESLRTRLSESA